MPNESTHLPRGLCTLGKTFPSPWPSAEVLMVASSCHLAHSQEDMFMSPAPQIFS